MATKRTHRMLVATLAVAALLAAASPALSDTAIWSCTLSGSSVNVTVFNPGPAPMSATLRVVASTSSGPQSRSVPVTVGPQSSVQVSVSFGANVTSAPIVAMSDDPTPF